MQRGIDERRGVVTPPYILNIKSLFIKEAKAAMVYLELF